MAERTQPVAWRLAAVMALAVVAVLATVAAPSVRRGPGFHGYADQRTWLGIPHAGDVLSNLPFVITGAIGLAVARRTAVRPRWLASLCAGAIVAIGLGSAAYHVDPGDDALALDWLPIVLTLGWLVALVVADRIHRTAGAIAAALLPIVAVAVVLVWWLGGGTGGAGVAPGDMRWYVALQVSLVAAVPVLVILYPVGVLPRAELLAGVACFLAARAAQAVDARLLSTAGISGHSLKHLAASAAAACVVRAIARATP